MAPADREHQLQRARRLFADMAQLDFATVSASHLAYLLSRAVVLIEDLTRIVADGTTGTEDAGTEAAS